MQSGKKNVSFDYDAMGNRIAKHVYDDSWMLEKSTYYILDAQGNQLSMYEHAVDTSSVNYTLAERNIYGSSRLGRNSQKVNLYTALHENPANTVLGEKYYELSNHLGNVLAVINDIKYPISTSTTVDYFEVALVSVSDYSPFGVQLDGRTMESERYRYGFQGQEKDDEVKGEGNSINYKYRMHDPRVGRFFAVDPHAHRYPSLSPYSAMANNPIYYIDPDGRDIVIPSSLKGSERRAIMRNLRKLTDDKLSYDKSSGQVTVRKQGSGNKTSGTQLVNNLISSSKTTTIIVGAEGSGNSATADSRTSKGRVDWTNATNGTGDNATVSFDPTANPDIPTVNPKTGNVSGKKRPNQIGLGHELIHADHINNGDVDFTPSTHTYNDANGNPTTQTVITEELRTVGLQGVKPGDVTENDLRREQRRTRKKRRGAY